MQSIIGRPGAHPAKNLKIMIILTFSYFHRDITFLTKIRKSTGNLNFAILSERGLGHTLFYSDWDADSVWEKTKGGDLFLFK